MEKMKTFQCIFACKNGKVMIVRMRANHISGAVRRLYQEFDVEDLKAIIPE